MFGVPLNHEIKAFFYFQSVSLANMNFLPLYIIQLCHLLVSSLRPGLIETGQVNILYRNFK
jgi:hypothetical protein